MNKVILATIAAIVCGAEISRAANPVNVSIQSEMAEIGNGTLAIQVDLSNGHYSGIDKTTGVKMFENASMMVDFSLTRQWKIPPTRYTAERLEGSDSSLGTGVTLRVWRKPEPASYDPESFLDITLYGNKSFVVLGWGIRNPFDHPVRICKVDILYEGELFKDQSPSDEKVLRSGAGAEKNFVESTWKIDAVNGAMLTYKDHRNGTADRRTIVAGGLKYAEFYRKVAFQQGSRKHASTGSYEFESPPSQFAGNKKQMTLTVYDPQGKRVSPGRIWASPDTVYLDFATRNPFVSLEQYGHALARANDAHPNAYNFPTLCGWAAGHLGGGRNINNSPELVKQMDFAKRTDILKYTTVAVRLEPDFYCYSRYGKTQQGWWDDAHWAQYGSLKTPYDTFGKFCDAVGKRGGIVFTYFQASLPSNDFAAAHPGWMLNNDISRLHVDHAHHRPLVRYDYSDPGFQDYTRAMWHRLRQDGVKGIKFDYPETAWIRYGGFEDPSFTTVSAYRKGFELCREGLGKSAFIHERIIGGGTHEAVPRTDVTAGVVDLQRIWSDTSDFSPEMASRTGLRWYKQGRVFRYYPDSKSFYKKKSQTPLSTKERRTMVTLVGLLSGRLELATGFDRMTPEMTWDLERIYPILPNGKAFRPVDMLLCSEHPSVYVYDVTDDWKQVILVNNDLNRKRTVSAPLSGNQADTGSIGLRPDTEYEVFDFWNQKYLGKRKGTEKLSVSLRPFEALVFSIRAKKTHPRIVGTSRHIMCGMLDVRDEAWDAANETLSFETDLVAGEITVITLAGVNTPPKRVSVLQDGASARSERRDGTWRLLLNAVGDPNQQANVTVAF